MESIQQQVPSYHTNCLRFSWITQVEENLQRGRTQTTLMEERVEQKKKKKTFKGWKWNAVDLNIFSAPETNSRQKNSKSPLPGKGRKAIS